MTAAVPSQSLPLRDLDWSRTTLPRHAEEVHATKSALVAEDAEVLRHCDFTAGWHDGNKTGMIQNNST
jgi:hypothetical protein